MAAAQLGYQLPHLRARRDAAGGRGRGRASPAAHYDDAEALRALRPPRSTSSPTSSRISPAEPLAALAAAAPLHPPLARARDRAGPADRESSSSRGLGGRPAPFAAVDDRAGLDAALAEIGAPAILKTRRFGYDGKGQARIDARRRCRRGLGRRCSGAPCDARRLRRASTPNSRSCSAAAPTARSSTWDAPRNVHDGRHPRSLDRAGRRRARAGDRRGARRWRAAIADALDYVGMLALEFFAVGDEAGVQRDGAARPQ